MRKLSRSIVYLLSGCALTGLGTGCVVERPRREVVVEEPAPAPDAEVVVEAPPPPRVEIVGVAPGPDFIWIGGFWGWDHGRYVWREGRWGHGPYRGARWEGGHWDHVRGGHVWVEGRWR